MMGEREAIASVAVLAMDADGVLSGDEDEDLHALLLEVEAFDGATEGELRDVLVKVDEWRRDVGAEALLREACASLPPHRRAEAYAIAADIVCVDETLEGEEAEFLERVEKALGLARDAADGVLATLGVSR